jgi:hypothetical protein
MYFRQLRLPDIGCASYIVGGNRQVEAHHLVVLLPEQEHATGGHIL